MWPIYEPIIYIKWKINFPNGLLLSQRFYGKLFDIIRKRTIWLIFANTSRYVTIIYITHTSANQLLRQYDGRTFEIDSGAWYIVSNWIRCTTLTKISFTIITIMKPTSKYPMSVSSSYIYCILIATLKCRDLCLFIEAFNIIKKTA